MGGLTTQTKKAVRLKSTKEQAIHRAKIIRGHIDSVIRMIEDDSYCLNVVHQSRAVQKAL